MSPSNDGNHRRGRVPYGSGKRAPWQPGDEQDTYTRMQLIRFDNRFRTRLLRAFQKGLENRESAASLCAPPATDNAPLRILAAQRRASRYRTPPLRFRDQIIAHGGAGYDSFPILGVPPR